MHLSPTVLLILLTWEMRYQSLSPYQINTYTGIFKTDFFNRLGRTEKAMFLKVHVDEACVIKIKKDVINGRWKQDGLLEALLYLCLAGSSLQAAAGSGQSWGFSKEVMESQRNTSVSQTSRLEATHRQPPLTDLGKCKRWSREKKEQY